MTKKTSLLEDLFHALLQSHGIDGVELTAQFTSDLEGWIGIPHGGINMGAMIALAERIGKKSFSTDRAFWAEYRMGGASARVGDRLHMSLTAGSGGLSGNILLSHTSTPYLTVRFTPEPPAEQPSRPLFDLPQGFLHDTPNRHALPCYRNCFVCGTQRAVPGLERTFFTLPDGTFPLVWAEAGWDEKDRETFFQFQESGKIHPVALMALVDETLGWACFFLKSQGGVTVRMTHQLLRPVAVTEKLIIFGYGWRWRGSIDRRLLIWSAGGAAVLHHDGSFEPVIRSWGQWMAVPTLTEQMKGSLIPHELAQKAFYLAGSSLD